MASVSGLHAQDTSEQEARRARLEREIALIDRQLAENSSKSSAMLSNLTLIRKKISNRKELVDESDRQIKKISDDIYLKQRQINRLQARVDT
jgi:chromosome segregation ATPase